MDVNGTRFHLLLGPRDWLPRLAETTAEGPLRPYWDAPRAQLTLQPELFRFPPRPAESPLTPEQRRGAARDRFGHVYWIDADRRTVRYRPRESPASAPFWSADRLAGEPERPAPAPGAFVACAPPAPAVMPLLSGLAVTERHFLVVGTREPGGLLVFDLHGGGAPVWLRWPDAVPFAPFDLAAAPGGGLWVLDRSDDGLVARLWRLDRDLRVVRAAGEVELATPPLPDAFRPLDPAPEAECLPPPRVFPAGIDLGLASPPVPGAGDALSVVALPDGTALVMEADAAAGDTRVHRWTLTGWQGGPPPGGAVTLGAAVSLAEALSALLDETTTLVGHDMAWVPDAEAALGVVAGTLHVADTAGNQSFAFHVTTGIPGTAEADTLEVRALPAYFPLRRWAGRALVEGCDGEAYYDLDDAWLPLTRLPRPRYARRGFLDGIVFDGREPGCVWHRLMLDACIPPGDAVQVESRAADTEAELPGLPWRPEPALRLRPGGPELPWTGPAWHPEPSAPGVGTWELLFQEAVGRFVEVRLTLHGSGRSSPKVRALRAHYPRFSYLRYLPAAYREDSASAGFLDRFLANFEGVLTELEGRIASAEVLFGHATAPREALDWLAGWLGATLDAGWDERRRRLFLAHAAELYRRRGTRRGLLAAVRLAIDPCPGDDLFADDREPRPFGFRLSEAFRQGDPAGAHRLTVLAPVGLSDAPPERLRLREAVAAVVERERPAHVAFDVQLYWALFRVGGARVGHETLLGEGSRFTALVLDAGYLGQSLLAERHPWNVHDRRVVGRDRAGVPPPLS